jgi:transposase-like protein
MSVCKWDDPMSALEADSSSQINVPPSRAGSLWKVIVPEIKCPACGSVRTFAKTGKRRNGAGMNEHYRQCDGCHIRFRVVFE